MTEVLRVPTDVRVTQGESGTLYVRPGTRLGPRFEAFRAACTQAGFRWDKRSANVGPGTALPRLLQVMEAAGFTVDLAPDVVAHLGVKLAKADEMAEIARAKMDRCEAMSGKTFRPYQRADVEFMERAGAVFGGGINANQQRTGKTVEFMPLFDTFGIVITPMAGVDVWVQHIREWRPDLRATVIRSSREFRWPEPGEVLVMHYECMPMRRVEGGKGVWIEDLFHSCPPHLLLVFDESQAIKNPVAARTKRARELVRAVLAEGGRAWEASGTPAPNVPRTELWHMLENLGLGLRLWPSKAAFVREVDWGEDGLVAGILSQVMVRRLRAHVLTQLPVVTREVILMPIPTGDAAREFDRLWRKVREQGLDRRPDELLRRLQWDPDFASYSEIRASLATLKIPKVLEVAEEYEEAEEPLVVTGAHKAPIEALMRRKGWGAFHGGTHPDKRAAMLRAFAAGTLNRGIAFTNKTGGVAVDCSRCGEKKVGTMLVVDRSWVPGDNAQAEDRIVNLADPEPLLYKYLRWEHVLEQHVEEILARKEQEIGRVVDAVSFESADPDRTLSTFRNVFEEAKAKWGPGVQEGCYPPPEEVIDELKAAGLSGLFLQPPPE